MSVAIDTILDEIARYPVTDKEMILDIMEKRLVEEKRELIYNDYREAVKDYEAGKVKSGGVDDLFNSIDD